MYKHQAEDLRAEAESLALEREPGDVQFDEESGEGGTVAVDRERDLTLSAQAMATIDEIDQALRAIESKMYGACEICGQPIPKARLRALPYAALVRVVQERGVAPALSDGSRLRLDGTRRLLVAGAVAAVVVAADQVTKSWAVHRLSQGPIHVIWKLDFQLQYNTGSSFSFAQGWAPVFAGIAVVVVVVLAATARQRPLHGTGRRARHGHGRGPRQPERPSVPSSRRCGG